MKTAKLAQQPMCDIHKHFRHKTDIPALYDGPTTLGHHGYMCQECMDDVGFPDSSITFKLEIV